jgi:acyl dehydratase
MSSRGAAKKLRPAAKPSPKPSPKVKAVKAVAKKPPAKPPAKVTQISKAPAPLGRAPVKPVQQAGRVVVTSAGALVKKPAAPPLAARPQLQAKAQPTLARSFYWSDLRAGDDLPPLVKPVIDRVQIARYASAAGDFNRLHLDEPYATALGYRGAFAPGALAMGFVSQMLTSWLRRGHVRKLTARFVKIVRPGDELTAHGRIAELRKEKGACFAELELWAENQKGELVLRGHATCELYESAAAAGAEGSLLFPTGPQTRPPVALGRQPVAPAKPLAKKR